MKKGRKGGLLSLVFAAFSQVSLGHDKILLVRPSGSHM